MFQPEQAETKMDRKELYVWLKQRLVEIRLSLLIIAFQFRKESAKAFYFTIYSDALRKSSI